LKDVGVLFSVVPGIQITLWELWGGGRTQSLAQASPYAALDRWSAVSPKFTSNHFWKL